MENSYAYYKEAHGSYSSNSIFSASLNLGGHSNILFFQKSAAAHLARHCSDARSERIYADWLWWILQGLPFTHLVRAFQHVF